MAHRKDDDNIRPDFEDNRQIYITPALGSAQSLRSGRYRLENWGRAQSCHVSIHEKT